MFPRNVLQRSVAFQMQLILSLRHCLRTNHMSYAEQFKLMQRQCRNSYSENYVLLPVKLFFKEDRKCICISVHTILTVPLTK